MPQPETPGWRDAAFGYLCSLIPAGARPGRDALLAAHIARKTTIGILAGLRDGWSQLPEDLGGNLQPREIEHGRVLYELLGKQAAARLTEIDALVEALRAPDPRPRRAAEQVPAWRRPRTAGGADGRR
ncbi:hypothetical protein BIV57_00505 [Mangrovactinospora gilvigrisea]|uniref:Uncharacterized protein n=1 Tax=Mangrovactinospora gilvigrisea TaxID=1428644 RepID=A0A1J7CIA1_9ACTN|nr:hypothetical protein BIV57_00505 [Mangrovactinospora gilvigrisea]